MIPHSHDVLVVGGGIVGASIAYYLSRRGIDVGVIERSHPGGGASGANAAIIGTSLSSPLHYARFEQRSIRLFLQLSDETGRAIRFQPCGRLSLLQDARALKRVEGNIHRNHEAGIPVELIRPEDVGRLEPEIATTRIVGAALCPTDGQIDPFATLRILVSRTLAQGSTYYFHSPVRHIDCSGSGVRVATEGDVYHASTLVVAAGIQTPELIAPLGWNVAVRPVRGQILVTEALPTLFRHVISPGITQCPEGNVLLGVSTEEAGFDRRTTLPALQAIAKEALAKAPILRSARLLRTFAGLRPMPFDGLPILDSLPGRENVFVAVAHNAVTSSQAIGSSMAEWIAESRRPEELVQYRLTRPSLAERPTY